MPSNSTSSPPIANSTNISAASSNTSDSSATDVTRDATDAACVECVAAAAEGDFEDGVVVYGSVGAAGVRCCATERGPATGDSDTENVTVECAEGSTDPRCAVTGDVANTSALAINSTVLNNTIATSPKSTPTSATAAATTASSHGFAGVMVDARPPLAMREHGTTSTDVISNAPDLATLAAPPARDPASDPVSTPARSALPYRCVVLATSCDCAAPLVRFAGWAGVPLVCVTDRDIARRGAFALSLRSHRPPAATVGTKADDPSTAVSASVVLLPVVAVVVPVQIAPAPSTIPNTTATHVNNATAATSSANASNNTVATPTTTATPTLTANTTSSNTSTAVNATTRPGIKMPSDDVIRPGHQQSIFVQLLSRIEALEHVSNLTEQYLERLGAGYMKLNMSQSNLTNISHQVSTLRHEVMILANSTTEAAKTHAIALQAVLSVCEMLAAQAQRASDTQAAHLSASLRLEALVQLALFSGLVCFAVLCGLLWRRRA